MNKRSLLYANVVIFLPVGKYEDSDLAPFVLNESQDIIMVQDITRTDGILFVPKNKDVMISPRMI